MHAAVNNDFGEQNRALAGGAIGTIVCSLGLIIVYQRLRVHPSRLMQARSIADFIFGVAVFVEFMLRDAHSTALDEPGECAPFSFVMQLSCIASELWFGCVSLDLVTAIRSPFTDYRKQYRMYSMLCWGLATLSGTIILALGTSVYGPTQFGVCWLRPTSDNGAINAKMWLAFYAPMTCIYFWSVLALIYASLRLKRGLADSYELRRKVFNQECIVVLGFTAYWTVAGVLYGIAIFSDYSALDSSSWAGWTFSGWFGCKGVASLAVFFLAHSRTEIRQACCRRRRGRSGQHAVDVNLEPRLNGELREEVLRYSMLAIRVSVGQLHRSLLAAGGVTASESVTANPLAAVAGRRPADGVLDWAPGPARNASMYGTQSQPLAARFAVRSASAEGLGVSGPDASEACDELNAIRRGAASRKQSRYGMAATHSRAQKLLQGSVNRRSLQGKQIYGWRTVPINLYFGLLREAVHGTPQPGLHRDTTTARSGTGAGAGSLPAQGLLRSASVESTGPSTQSNGLQRQPLGALFCVGNSVAARDTHPPLRVRDLAPDIFAELRALSGVGPQEYVASVLQHQKASFSEGQSGAFIVFSADRRFVMKTMRPAEAATLKRILPAYLAHFENNPDSLLCRIFGCMEVRMYTRKMYIVVMESVFWRAGQLRIHDRFDLKGSWYGRSAYKGPRPTSGATLHFEDEVVDSSSKRPVLKDNDMNFRFRFSHDKATKLAAQLNEDVEFLRKMRLLDYSLLVGVHRRKFDVNLRHLMGSQSGQAATPNGGDPVHPLGLPPLPVSPDAESAPPRVPFHQADFGGISPAVMEGPAVYFMGVIDYLQEWNTVKRLERAIKTRIIRQPADGISVMHPDGYAARFRHRVVREAISDGASMLSPTHRQGVVDSEDGNISSVITPQRYGLEADVDDVDDVYQQAAEGGYTPQRHGSGRHTAPRGLEAT